MSFKTLVTQDELRTTIDSLNALADNLDEHVNQSLSKGHGWNIVNSVYLDSGGNYHTDFGSASSLVSIPGLFNTGVNNNGTLANPGTVDQHWVLTQSASTTYHPPTVYIQNPLHSGYASNGPNSQWIGLPPSGNDSVSHGTYIFRITIDLTGLNPATAVISGVWACDDKTTSVLLNGNITGFTLGTGSWTKQPAAKFVFTGPFLPGVNTLDFVISNSGGGECTLRVEIAGKAAVGGARAIPGLWNTGVNASNVVLPQNSTELHWTLAHSSDPLNPGPNLYLMKLGGSYAANSALSAWIGPRKSGDVPAGLYTYRLTFDLTGLNPNTAILKGQFWSNDITQNAYINGISLGITNTNAGKTYPVTFVITTGFLSGINTLDFIVNTNTQDSGFRAEISGTAVQAGSGLTSCVLRLTVGGNVLYIPCQQSGGMDGIPDSVIRAFTGIVSPQSADPATDLTVGSPTSTELVTTFADVLSAISGSASDTLLQHAGSSAESVHSGISFQTDQVFTTGGYLVGRRSVNILIDGIQYKIVADNNLSGPLSG